MAIFSLSGLKISGISACVPSKTLFTKDYSRMNGSELKMFINTVGVESRRVTEKGITTLDLCVKAAEKLLTGLNWKKDEVFLEIFVTQSRDYYLPSNALIAQHKLGLPNGCMAFDICLGCSGYIYGLSVVASLLKTTGIKKALLLVGDISTVNCSFDDKSTYPLFGDAGTATAIELSGDDTEWSFNFFSDGAGFESIIIPDGGMRNWVSHESLEYRKGEDGYEKTGFHLALKGMDIFNFSISKVPPSIKDLMEYCGKSIDSFDYFIFHQANLLINETIRKKTGIPKEKLPYSIHRFGNTSSASIPLTIVNQIGKVAAEKKLSLLLSGFGVGLSWGNASIITEKIVCPEIIEFGHV